MAGDTKLTSIARRNKMMKEDIKNEVKSISRSINNSTEEELEEMENKYLMRAEKIIKELRGEVLVIIDFSDINKERGKKFENIDEVYDGSTGKKISKGYWVLTIIVYYEKKDIYIPLINEVFSLSNGETSMKTILYKKLKKVIGVVGKKGVYVFDRGFDDRKLIEYMTEEGLKFIIGGYRDRIIEIKGMKYKLKEYVSNMLKGKRGIIYYIKSERVEGKIRLKLKIRYERVKIKGMKEEINLISSYDEIRGTERYFYTNIDIKTEIGALKIIKKYLKRWKIEEYLQFIKTNFGMEKFRIRKYKSIKLLIFLVMVAFMFLTTLLIAKEKSILLLLKEISQSISKKISLYTYAAGIRNLSIIILIFDEFFERYENFEV